MFAAGSGIAPFMGFLQARASRPGSGESWLFFGTRTPDEFLHRHRLERLAAAGHVRLGVAFSRRT